MANLKYKHTAYTSAQWASLNPVIVENEIVIESDTKRTKIGNGISTYNQLEYADANSIGNSLGSIKPTDAAPTPARNGNYTFSIGGNKPAWLTAEAGITTVKAGDGVAVVYDGVSAYTYTHVDMSGTTVNNEILTKLIGGSEISYPTPTGVGYYTVTGTIDVGSPQSRYFNVSVVNGDKYLVYCRINKNIRFVNISAGIVSINSSAVETLSTFDGRWYMITAGATTLGISSWDYPNIIVIHISKESSYDRINGLLSLSSSVASNSLDVDAVKKYFFSNSGATAVALPSFTQGYYNNVGVLSTEGSSHVNIAVEQGAIYAVLSRLTSATSIVALNSIDATSGAVLYKGWTSTGWQLRFVKTTTGFLGVSNINSDNSLVSVYKLTNGWLYDLQNILLSSGGLVAANSAVGIIPSAESTIGSYAISDNYITTQGICTNYGSMMPTTEKLLTNIRFHANKAGTIRFGIGTIDQRNWAIIRTTFDVQCVAGANNINITNLGLKTVRNGYLFAYNNIDGLGCSIGYKLRASSYNNYYFYSDDTTSALHSLDTGPIANAAYLCLSYSYSVDNLIYELKNDADEINFWAQNALEKTALTRCYSDIVQGTDGLYKLAITSGVITASMLQFNKVTIFGNSIFTHDPLTAGWLAPFTDTDGTWIYDGEIDAAIGMSGRGMAVTQRDFDFKHLLRRGLQSNFENVIVQGANIASTERDLPSVFPSYLDSLLTNDVDVVIWRAGENVSSLDLYKDALRGYISHFKDRCPNAVIILTGRFWKNTPSDIITSQIADEFRLPFIRMYMSDDRYQAKADDIISYPVTNGMTTKIAYGRIASGAGHPNNLGMYEIANKLLLSLAQTPLNLLHKINITNSADIDYQCESEQIEGALFSIRITGALPSTINIIDGVENEIEYQIREKVDYGTTCDHVITFIVPTSNVYVYFN